MNNWDLIIYEDTTKTTIQNRFLVTDEHLDVIGQHGRSIILRDEKNYEWLLKIFENIIDFDLKEIMNLDVDIEDTPDESRDRMHLWRVLSELVASRLAQRLGLNVPEAIIVCSQPIADFKLESDTLLPLRNVVILDDEEGGPESADEYYKFSSRTSYTLESSNKFDEILKVKSKTMNATTVLALLIKKIPNSINLDQYIDSFGQDHEKAFTSIREVTDGYNLLPFDIWLNDPDRNAGNYLIGLDDNDVAKNIWGIDYEMWSLGSDQIEDEIAMGRSYLAAIIHTNTNIFDERILKTVHRIRSLDDKDIILCTRAPQLLCKFFEYHIHKNNLESEERIVLKQVESNLEDFLLESRPRSDKLSEILIKQIGLPSDFDN